MLDTIMYKNIVPLELCLEVTYYCHTIALSIKILMVTKKVKNI